MKKYWTKQQKILTLIIVLEPYKEMMITISSAAIKPSNIAILLKIIKDNQNIDNISIIKNNKGYFK